MKAIQLTNPTFVKITNTICRQKIQFDELFLRNVDGDVYDPYIVIVMTQLWKKKKKKKNIGFKMPKENFEGKVHWF